MLKINSGSLASKASNVLLGTNGTRKGGKGRMLLLSGLLGCETGRDAALSAEDSLGSAVLRRTKVI